MRKIILFLCLILVFPAMAVSCGSSGGVTTSETSSETQALVSTPSESKSPEASSSVTSADPPVSTLPDSTGSTIKPENPADSNYKNTKWNGKTLKILAIGNSFSVDAMTYLYDIAKAEGVEEIVLGNLYIGGCTLQTHAENAAGNKAAYQYFKASSETKGRFVERANTTLLYGIRDEEWDIITMQQVSGSSGLPNTYNHSLSSLITYVNANKINKNAQLAWHMTWAYQSDSNHAEFSNYQKKQDVMYQAIVRAVEKAVFSTDAFSILIPSGTAVQNTRTSYFGDRLTRDGYHLNETARFIAGYTWFTTLTGRNLTTLKCNPASLSFSEEDRAVILEAVNAAYDTPLGVTNSTHTEKPVFDLSGYTELFYDYTVGAYWNSGDASHPNELFKTAGNSKNYIATGLFDKETLPVGTVIVLDEGWQYRPERWVGLGQQAGRPEPVTNEIFVVTEDFWNGYRYRAFNLSVIGADRDITGEANAVSHMRFYLPSGVTVPDKTVVFEKPPVTEFDPATYDKLTLTWTVGGYWNSTDRTNFSKVITGADNSGYFAATQRFSRETLPVGAVLVVDEGWQYRPEAWKADEVQPSSTRPGNVKTRIVEVTESWWGDYEFRAFNLSRIDGGTVRNDSEATLHFTVYLPKKG